jgi:hypothetical protein
VKAFYLPEEDRWTLRVAASTVKQLIKWNCCSFEKAQAQGFIK